MTEQDDKALISFRVSEIKKETKWEAKQVAKREAKLVRDSLRKAGKKVWSEEMNQESRHTDITPIECSDCGWSGAVSKCYHTYQSVHPDDVEPVDRCPKCDSMNLIEPEKKKVLVDLD